VVDVRDNSNIPNIWPGFHKRILSEMQANKPLKTPHVTLSIHVTLSVVEGPT